MIQKINKNQFIDAFVGTQYKDNFSIEAREALFDYLEETFDGNYEFDLVSVACDFTEYDNVIEGACNYFTFEGMTYGEEGEELKTYEEVEEEARIFLENRTTVIYILNSAGEKTGGVIIENF